jgi:hypothetical protein
MPPSRRIASVNPFSESPGIPYTWRTPESFRIDTITSATVAAIVRFLRCAVAVIAASCVALFIRA